MGPQGDMKRPDDGKRKRGKADPQMHEMRHNNYRGLYDNFKEVRQEQEQDCNFAKATYAQPR